MTDTDCAETVAEERRRAILAAVNADRWIVAFARPADGLSMRTRALPVLCALMWAARLGLDPTLQVQLLPARGAVMGRPEMLACTGGLPEPRRFPAVGTSRN